MIKGDAKLITRPPLYAKLVPVLRKCMGNLLESIDGIKAQGAFATNITILVKTTARKPLLSGGITRKKIQPKTPIGMSIKATLVINIISKPSDLSLVSLYLCSIPIIFRNRY